MIAVVDVFDGVVQVGVELVSCLRCQGKGWGIGADKCYKPYKSIEARRQPPF